jgi:hypothetical protein
MTHRLSEDRLRDLIVDAYEDVHLTVPLSQIRSAAQAKRRRTNRQLVAVAAAVAVTAGSLVAVSRLTAPDSGTAEADTAVAGWPPVRTFETTAADGCEPEGTFPPFRIEAAVDPANLTVRVYADERLQLTCLTGDAVPPSGTHHYAVAYRSADQLYPAGQLSNNTSHQVLGEVDVAMSFGRAPAGTTRVEVVFGDGSRMDAQLKGEWYLLVASGKAAGERFSTVRQAVAHTPNGVVTEDIPQGPPPPTD